MALVNGTNFGFVETAPVADPGGSNSALDTYAKAIKVVAPAGATTITEIGWWCEAVSQSTNFEVGLYDHNAGSDKPGSRLYVDDTNAVGSGGTWQTVAVDWAITAGTTYWIAIQVDAATGTTYDNWGSVVSERYSQASAATLAATWDAGSSQTDDVALAYYAVYTAITPVTVSATLESTGEIDVAVSVKSGTTVSATIEATGEITGAAGTGSVEVVVAPNWQTDTFKTIKRLLVIGNDALYYEDI